MSWMRACRKSSDCCRCSAHHHELSRHELAQRAVEHGAVERDDLRQQAAIELPADHGGDLRDLLRGRRQAIEPRHEGALQAVRDMDVVGRVLAAFEDRSRQFLDEEGDAVGPCRDPVDELI